MMKSVAVFLATGFEESEAVIIIDILRRANITVDIISVEDLDYVGGGHKIFVKSDIHFIKANFQVYDMLVLPGGSLGVDNLQKNEQLLELLKDFNNKNKFIAAICAAPQILYKLGIVNHKTISVYPDSIKNLDKVTISKKGVSVDKNIITGTSMGCAINFSLKLVEILLNKDKMNIIQEELVIIN